MHKIKYVRQIDVLPKAVTLLEWSLIPVSSQDKRVLRVINADSSFVCESGAVS